MPYTTLRQLFYQLDEDAYREEYLRRYNSDETIRLDFDIHGKQAFFCQSTDVIKTMFSILKINAKIVELQSKLPGIALNQYSKKCLIDEIVLTNKIEGVHSSRKEIGDALSILEEQSTEKGNSVRFFGLVSKYVKLLIHDPVPLETCQDIRNIYDEIVLNEVVLENKNNAPDGKIFRKEQTAIHSATDKVIHEGITPESKIISYMEKALAFLHDDNIEELYRICLFHYLIEYIHPFYDGNGRLGRFILSYSISNALEPLLSYRISEIIKEHRSEYYKAFTECNDRKSLGDITPFLLMMLKMIERAATDLRDSLHRKSISWERYSKLIPTLDGAESQDMRRLYGYLIQGTLFGEQGISNKELRSLLDIVYTTLKRRLDIVDQQGLLITNTDREKYYQIDLDKLDDMLLEA